MPDAIRRTTVVLVDFSGLAWTCYEPALSAEEAGKKALAAHREVCASCELGDPCDAKPKQYDAKRVTLTNVDLKLGSISEQLDVPVKQWLMVKDGHDTTRRALWPAYKANREQKPFDPRPLVQEYLTEKKGCTFMWAEDAEADDAIATMTHDLVEANFDVVIVSSDKDLWQLWQPPRVRIFLTTKNEFLGKEYLYKKFPERSKTSKVPGIEDVRHVRLCKALWGDPSDNIPNAMPRAQADLVPLIKSSDGTLEDFLSRCTTVTLGDKVMGRLEKALGQIRINYDIVGLRGDVTAVPVESPPAL